MSGWSAGIDGTEQLQEDINSVSENLESATFIVGTSTEYSIEVEYGTSSMQANRGMRDAIERAQREADAKAAEVESSAELARWMAYRIEELWKAGIAGELSGPRRVDTGNLLRSIRAERIE